MEQDMMAAAREFADLADRSNSSARTGPEGGGAFAGGSYGGAGSGGSSSFSTGASGSAFGGGGSGGPGDGGVASDDSAPLRTNWGGQQSGTGIVSRGRDVDKDTPSKFLAGTVMAEGGIRNEDSGARIPADVDKRAVGESVYDTNRSNEAMAASRGEGGGGGFGGGGTGSAIGDAAARAGAIGGGTGFAHESFGARGGSDKLA